jgi:hypothetical protein
MTFVLEMFRIRLRGRESLLDAKEGFVVAHLTQNAGRGQLSIRLSSAYKWMRAHPTA